MNIHNVEIGHAERPVAVVTTRVRSGDGSLGLTCLHADAPSMAALLMDELATRRGRPQHPEVRLYRPWPTPPERYRIVFETRDGQTVHVAVEAGDGRTADATVPVRDVHGTAASLMQRLRRGAHDAEGHNAAPMPTRDSPPLESGPNARPMGGGWPEDEEFPLAPGECVALVKGMGVVPRRSVSSDQLLQLPGKWEMIQGRLRLHRI